MKTVGVLLVSLFVLIGLVACVSTQPSGPSIPNPPANPTKILLKMDLGEALPVTKQVVGEFYLLYVKITERSDPELNWITIESTDLTFELKKGATYLLGIAEKTPQGIKTKGVITAGGLSAIPISPDATSVLDLGKIFRGEDGFYSKVDVGQLANIIGYTQEVLKSFKGYDVTLKHFLNPDINKNGVFDKEEGLKWSLTTMVNFYIHSGEFYREYQNGDVRINEKAIENISQYLSSEVVLVLWLNWPDLIRGDTVENWTCEINNSRIRNKKQDDKREGEGNDRSWWQFYFRLDRSDVVNGSYSFSLNNGTGRSIELELDSVNFAYSIESSEYFILPIPKAICYSNGKLKALAWRWFRWKDDTLEVADPALVRLVHKQADDFGGYFYFYTYPSYAPDDYEQIIRGSEKHFSEQENCWAFLINGWMIHNYISHLRLTAWDVARNDLGIHVPIYFLPHPHDISSDTSGTNEIPINSILLNGKYNFDHFFSKSGNEEPLKFGLMSFSEDGTFTAKTYWFETNGCIVEEFHGKFSVKSEGILEIKIKDQGGNENTYYFVFKSTDTYIEGNVYTEEPTQTIIDRSAPNYRVYSILK